MFFVFLWGVSRVTLPWGLKKFILLLASYLFYAAWSPPLVALLWVSTIAGWIVVQGLGHTERIGRRRALLVVGLIINLGLLGYFKYGGFLLENFTAAVHWLGWKFVPPALDLLLPVGISFYTFRTLSYIVDVYKRKTQPWPSFLDYALYVTFFPQLLAGPIMRATDFLPQCAEPRRATDRQLGWGLTLFVVGLFEKIVVADTLMAPVAAQVFDVPEMATLLAAWVGTLAFANQIFCDFAGYSTCAIGVAMCLGFMTPDNFRFPYAAIGFTDFWRRWHISLSSWLRDYLYISLGGNRKGRIRTYVNLMATMLLGGLWHGASWTFVVWGGLHGLYLVVERALKAVVPDRPLWHRSPVKLLLALLTFAMVCIAWVFFRAKTFDRAFMLAMAMLGNAPSDAPLDMASLGLVASGTVALVTFLVLAVHWFMRDSSLEETAAKCPWWVRAAILAAMLVAIVTLSGEERAFLYFQF